MFLIRTVFWLVVLTLVVPAGASGADPGANGTGGLPAIGSNDPAARAMTAPAYR